MIILIKKDAELFANTHKAKFDIIQHSSSNNSDNSLSLYISVNHSKKTYLVLPS